MPNCLLIGTVFFPFPTVGTVRMTNWARGLGERGIGTTVVCRDYGHRASRRTLDERVHPLVDVRALGPGGTVAPLEDRAPGRAGEPSAPSDAKRLRDRLTSFSGLGWVVPDPQRFFWQKALPRIGEIAREVRPDVVITSSPMHSVHAAGRWLKRTQGLPWVADYRDPHSINPAFMPRGWAAGARPLHRAYERAIYREADEIWHAIPIHGRWARRAYPWARDKCRIITHPVPADMLLGAEPAGTEPAGRRSVRVVGVLASDTAELLARAVRTLADEGLDLELRLVGGPPENAGSLRDLLGERLVVTGRLRHDAAKAQILGADVLVNAVSKARQKNVLISSKLYEYAAARKPIIAFNPTRADRWLLRRLPGVQRVDDPDVGTVASALRAVLENPAEAGSRSGGFLEDFGWDRHMDYVASLLRGLAAAGTRG